IGCPFVFVSFKTDYNTQSSVYFYSIHPKVVKKKEDKELEALEEEDDDFFSEAESEEEIGEAEETEVEDEE
ncbi:hypothetical protein, partial [Streptococcus agalactiae]|uniref:hypothetical protein n=1 Tax=Streptococcus agalactiae TaxID=1311 RepID=UPI00050CF8AF